MLQIQRFDNVLSAEECSLIIAAATPKVRPSVIVGTERRYASAARTSHDCRLTAEEMPARAQSRLSELIVAATKQPPSHMEGWTIIRYEAGQYFRPHHDSFHQRHYADLMKAEGGQRLFTALVFLQAPEGGGETDFPALPQRFTAEPGTMLLWNNTTPGGQQHRQALHQSTPVTGGTKWSMSTWIRERPYQRAEF